MTIYEENTKVLKKEFTFGYFDTLRLMKDNLSKEHFREACKYVIKAMGLRVSDLIKHEGEWFYEDIMAFAKDNEWEWDL